MLRQRKDKVKHRVVVEVCFDIEDNTVEEAQARAVKIEQVWMSSIMERLGPWLESGYKSIKVVSLTPLDNSNLLRPAEREQETEAKTLLRAHAEAEEK